MARTVTGDTNHDVWIWIIEYLAKFKKDLFMVDDVFRLCPQIPDDLGQHATEMVAFRCLVSLFDPCNEQNIDTSSCPETKVEFDLSESCEYVLQCILDEISLSNLKPGAPELSKWNVVPFIANKRFCLPKCALELLRDTMTESTEPVCHPFPERNVSIPQNVEERTRIVTEGKHQVGLDLDGHNSSQRTEEDGSSQAPASGNELVGNGSYDGYRLSRDTMTCDLMISDNLAENSGKQDTTVIDDELCTDAMKLKLDALEANLPDNPLLMLSQCSELFVDDITVAGMDANLSKDDKAGRKELDSREHDHDCEDGMMSSKLVMIGDVDNSKEIRDVVDDDSGLAPVADEGKTISRDGPQTLEKCPSNQDQEEADLVEDNAQNQMEYIHETELNDRTRQTEKTVVATGEDHQDLSLSPSRITVCRECKKSGGRLLVCSRAGCVFMVHENCWASTPLYDEKGDFYCPPCTYTRATTEYLESKIQVAKAKKRLVGFLNLLNSKRRRILTERMEPQDLSNGEKNNNELQGTRKMIRTNS